jgi:hypothetical protein
LSARRAREHPGPLPGPRLVGDPQATYDAAVKVKAAKGGVDITKNVVDVLI